MNTQKRKSRILVVNDTQEILELFRIALEQEGYEVFLSSYPLQKFREVEQLHVDLIILDFVFGDRKTGWQMVQMLKMHPPTSAIPLIVCTAAIEEVREQEGYLVSKGVLIIYKPFDLEEMLSIVQEAIESRRTFLAHQESNVQEDMDA